MKKFMFSIVVFLLLIFALTIYPTYRSDMAYARQRVESGSELLMTNKGLIEYAISGHGTPVLMIHGAGGGYDQGLFMGKAFLGDGYQLISISRFGYLRSPFLQDSTVESQAALYAALLDYLGIEQVIVVGVSAGGPSAMQFALDYPDRSKGLVLISAVSMYMGDHIPLSTKIINAIQSSDLAYWATLKMFRAQFFEMVGVSQEIYEQLSLDKKQLADEMLNIMHPMSPRLPGNLHEANIKPLSGEAMEGILTPTIVFHAKDDMLVGYEHAEHVHSHIKHSKLTAFEQGGHGLIGEIDTIQGLIAYFFNYQY